MRLMPEVLPEWIREGRDISHVSDPDKTLRQHDYFRHLWQATPVWLTKEHRDWYHTVYREMRRLRKMGRKVCVDHIVPLRSAYVCGLNVPWNLRIIEELPNRKKSNLWWPGHPWETPDMFDPEPQQLRLL